MQAGHLQRQCKTKEIFIFNCSCHNIWNIVFCSFITDSIGSLWYPKLDFNETIR